MAIFAALVALSSAFLGGDTTTVGQAVPIIGVGFLLVISPLRALPNPGGLIGIIGLIVCALFGFLPASWFGEPAWHLFFRRTIPGLTNDVSLQPLITLTGLCRMLSAIFFGIWVVQWRPTRRVLCVRVLAGAIAILAAAALAAYAFSIPVPGWRPSQGFGPFANRNQTGTLMALGGMLALGLCAYSIRVHRTDAPPWAMAFGICLVALFYSNSRGPLCLLALASFSGILIQQKISAKGSAIALSVFLLISSAALLFGGNVSARLFGLFSEGVGLRVQIYQDTFQLVKTALFAGIGLGNFDAIFPWFRDASLNGQRILHPESDWLWLVAETGVVSVFFLVIASVCCFGWPVRLARTREQDVQLACKIAIVLFILNSLFDVPGHRLGTILPLLFVAGIYCCSTLTAEGAPAIPWISRLLGVGLLAFGICLLRADSTKSQLQLVLAHRDFEQVEKLASRALTRAPLNWSLYVTRGYANVYEKKLLQAIADFRRALFLEPKMAVVPFEEGRAWIGVNVPMAVAAWKECLKRSSGNERNDYFRQILDVSANDERLLEATLRLSDGDPALALVALRSGRGDSQTLRLLEQEKPKLDPEQIRVVLKAEARKAAAEKDFQQAYELARRAVRDIPFPNRQQRSEQACRIALIENPGDISAAFDLCLVLEAEKRHDEAVSVLDSVCRNRNCPAYLQLMKADCLASLMQWPAAWEVISGLL
ncbi:MAG: O-antigen ligase family protein [Verrucomicrobia bacterium]|nr:O-antigen ligase family protein [Verrucomicrobiota bacterium]